MLFVFKGDAYHACFIELAKTWNGPMVGDVRYRSRHGRSNIRDAKLVSIIHAYRSHGYVHIVDNNRIIWFFFFYVIRPHKTRLDSCETKCIFCVNRTRGHNNNVTQHYVATKPIVWTPRKTVELRSYVGTSMRIQSKKTNVVLITGILCNVILYNLLPPPPTHVFVYFNRTVFKICNGI